ncbi:MAG TPA: ribonuclease P protein component, partial [Longimicrobiales bacterium]|nr:ribonuclease P protein component [Longimicrobiales bacterium]
EQRGRRYPRARRITRGSEIRMLFRRGKRSRTPHLDVLVADSPTSFSRVGLVVPKYGNTAVRRNTVKRRLREALRREVLPRLDAGSRGTDLLVRARREAYGVPYAELAGELTEWMDTRWPVSS